MISMTSDIKRPAFGPPLYLLWFSSQNIDCCCGRPLALNWNKFQVIQPACSDLTDETEELL